MKAPGCPARLRPFLAPLQTTLLGRLDNDGPPDPRDRTRQQLDTRTQSEFDMPSNRLVCELVAPQDTMLSLERTSWLVSKGEVRIATWDMGRSFSLEIRKFDKSPSEEIANLFYNWLLATDMSR